jgi:hypothetical protein
MVEENTGLRSVECDLSRKIRYIWGCVAKEKEEEEKNASSSRAL